MKLGINLPWCQYGQDIGRGVTAAKPAPGENAQSKPLFDSGLNQDKTMLDTLFSQFKALGIDAVRWFLLADGLNLNPPTLDDKGRWKVVDSTLEAYGHLQDFEKILQVCARQNMLLMPVFVDNAIFGPPVLLLSQFGTPKEPLKIGDVPIPPGATSVDDFVDDYYKDPVQKFFRDDSKSVDWRQFIKNGRGPILRQQAKLDPAPIDSFLSTTLKPLLDTARSDADYANQILAWDLINEPEMALYRSTKAFASVTPDPISADGLAYFIQAGLKMIIQAGFRATVGFQTAMPLGQNDGFRAKHNPQSDELGAAVDKIASKVTQLNLLKNPKFMLQWHYYPTSDEDQTEQTTLLKRDVFGSGPGTKTAIGEFATATNPHASSSPWGADIAGPDTIPARLKAVADKGYDWAFPWSATDGGEAGRHSRFDVAQYQSYKANP